MNDFLSSIPSLGEVPKSETVVETVQDGPTVAPVGLTEKEVTANIKETKLENIENDKEYLELVAKMNAIAKGRLESDIPTSEQPYWDARNAIMLHVNSKE